MSRRAPHRRQGRVRRGALPFTTLVAPLLLLAGCGGGQGSAGDADLCERYDEIVATAEDFSELDPAETSADELRARAADLRDRLDELQAVAKRERIATALANLEESLDAARDTAAEAGNKAEDRVAQAEKSLEEVGQKWDRVQALLADRCT